MAAIFACLSQRTAKLFTRFPALTAYTLDIAGSCAGILSFMLVSALKLPAWVWFAVFAGLLVASLTDSWRVRWFPLAVAVAMVVLVRGEDAILLGKPGYRGPVETTWSPYQRVQYRPDRRSIYVNGVAHQGMMTADEIRRDFYQTAHDARRGKGQPPYRNVLIIGAGSGNDVAAALVHGAEHVDAVEIDPVIAGLGRRHHDARPYADPRVNLMIDDGRAFMTRTSAGTI